MDDLISRKALLEDIEETVIFTVQKDVPSAEMRGANKVIDRIKAASTIDPESLRPLGVWVGEADGYADGELVYDVWYCSDCNYCIDDGTDDPALLPNFCPKCGAKMKEADKIIGNIHDNPELLKGEDLRT